VGTEAQARSRVLGLDDEIARANERLADLEQQRTGVDAVEELAADATPEVRRLLAIERQLREGQLPGGRRLTAKRQNALERERSKLAESSAVAERRRVAEDTAATKRAELDSEITAATTQVRRLENQRTAANEELARSAETRAEAEARGEGVEKLPRLEEPAPTQPAMPQPVLPARRRSTSSRTAARRSHARETMTRLRNAAAARGDPVTEDSRVASDQLDDALGAEVRDGYGIGEEGEQIEGAIDDTIIIGEGDETRVTTVRTLLKEIEEDRAFLKEWKDCLGR
jgi:hypothetical protein